MKISSIFAALVAAGLAIIWAWCAGPASYSPSEVEKQIRSFCPQLESRLAENSAFAQTAAGYQPKLELPRTPAGLKPQEAQAWMAFAQLHAGDDALIPTFPEHYSGGMQVRGAGMAVSLRPLGGNAASARIENGKLVYHDAYRSTDSVNVVSENRSEEFLLLHDAQAPQRFDYDLSAISGVKDVRLSDNAIHLTNAQGQQLQIEAPWLVDSSGQKIANAVHWEITYPNGNNRPRFSLVVANAAKLHYPVVIDPTWVNTNGSMATSRYGHTATLLNNGLVLVAGGYTSGVGYTSSCELFNPATGLWKSAHGMASVRFAHTATLLRTGKVLAAGGYNGSSSTNTAELYDPASDSWSTANSFATARYDHTATLLGDGTVLVVGGGGSTGTNDVEVYTPGSNSWATTTHLITGRLGHTATLLANGAVLVAGGESSTTVNHVLNSAEIFSNGVWTSTGTMVSTRLSHTATLLPNGKVLVAGGEDTNGNTLNTAELFTPNGTGGTWAGTGQLTTARNGHTATLLPNGTVMVAGGQNSSGVAIGTVEIYSGSSWSAAGTLVTARDGQTATLLPSGSVLVAGGDDSSNNTLASAELYNSASGTWANTTGSLSVGRFNFRATLLGNGQVLVEGGEASSGNATASSELYNPATESWTTTGSLHDARLAHTATLLPSGQVLVAGGQGNAGLLATSELFNPASGTWTYTTGSLHTARDSHTATLLPNGLVLVAGGGDVSGNFLASSELYNPATGTWTATGNLQTARENHTATLLPNGQILVAGGGTGSDNVMASAELYNPATGTWTTTGNLNNARLLHTATLLPSGLVLAAGGIQLGALASAELYNPATGIWTNTGSLNTSRFDHTATLLPNGEVLVAAGQGGADIDYLNSAEIYNPATGAWTTTGNLTLYAVGSSATLLANGQVLVASGLNDGNFFTTSELFNPGLGYTSATQPTLNTIASASSTSALALTGSNFTGVSEASGGGTENSASNIPVVQLESLANEQVLTVPLDPSHGFTPSAFTSLNVTGGVPGSALLTMFVNGTPSISQIISYTSPQAPAIVNSPSLTPLYTDYYYDFVFIATGNPAPTYAVTAGALPTGLTLSAAGEISGTPTVPGTYTGTITASNGTSPAATQTFSSTVYWSYSGWTSYYGLTGNNVLPTAILAHDGLTNLMKYSLGLNPFASYNPGNTSLPVVKLQNISGTNYLTLTFTGVAPDVIYTVQASSDLSNWSTLYSYQGTPPPGTVVVQDTQPITASAKRFLRLQVSQ